MPVVTAEDEDKVIALYLAGKSRTVILPELGYSTSAINTLLKKRNIPKMKKGNQIKYPQIADNGKKACLICHKHKSAAEFPKYKLKSGKIVTRNQCIKCRSKHVFNAGLQRLYGITKEEYDTLTEQQQGVCAVCGQPETHLRRGRLAIDHCHRTGKVRGLLCHRCNIALGFLEMQPLIPSLGAKLDKYINRDSQTSAVPKVPAKITKSMENV